MRMSCRASLGVVALLLVGAAACSTDSVTPPVREGDVAEFDPALGAFAGQASMPGLMFDVGSDAASTAGGCAWDAAEQRVVCAPVTRGGLTISRSFAFYDANGAAQQRRDETTVSMNTRVGVTGTIVGSHGSMNVERGSTLTVSGLGRGSTSHTLNGSESGTTSATRRTDRGSFTTIERFEARTENVIVPVPRSPTAWPLSGTTTRQGTVTVTREGGESRTHSFSRQVTFNGTRYVPVTMTRDGSVVQCTLDLASHRTECRR